VLIEAFMLRVERGDGRRLVLSVGQDDRGWFAIAIEGSLDRDLIGDHAHHLVGRFRNASHARREGDKYARRWLASEVLAPASCACPDIEERH
jgi:hypothetical protein